MALNQVVSGVGANSSRIDQNLVERTQRVQREATLANATGGAQGSLKMNRELSQGGDMPTTASAVSANPAPTGASVSIPPIDVFAQGRNAPLSEGAQGGPGGNQQQTPVDSIDQGSALARALYAANPESRQLRLLVEAYNEEGR
jgi:hypothetical protein